MSMRFVVKKGVVGCVVLAAMLAGSEALAQAKRSRNEREAIMVKALIAGL